MGEDLPAWLARKERQHLSAAENMRGDPEEVYYDAARFAEAASELARLRSELTDANAMVAQKSEQYVAERKAHEATRAELTASVAREAALRDALKHIAAYGDVDDTVDAALATQSPRAEKLLAVVETARRAIQYGGTLLLADAIRAYDNPEESNG